MNIDKAPKPYKGLAMEGMIASWYAKNTRSSLAEFQELARRMGVTFNGLGL